MPWADESWSGSWTSWDWSWGNWYPGWSSSHWHWQEPPKWGRWSWSTWGSSWGDGNSGAWNWEGRYLETEADQEERQRPTDDLDLCSPACIEDVRAPETHERGQPSTTVAPASSEPAEKGPSLAEVAETEEPTAWTSLQWQDDFTGAGHEPLKGKQFNDMIMAKASAGEILDLLDVSLLEFSVVNAVTALHRIAKAEDGHRWRKDPRIHYLNRRITAMFTSSKKDEMDKKETGRRVPGEDWVYYIDTRSLCNAAWAFAHLGLKHDAMMDIVSEETCRKIFDCSAQQLAMCAWSFAKMSRRDLQLMQSLADEAVQRLAEFSPQHIMNTVWACAKLNFLHVRLLVAIADAALPLLEDFTPQHLSITAWGLATLGFRHLPLMDGIAKEVLINLRAFKAQNIANTAWAYSMLGIYQRDLFDKLADFSTPRLRHFSPQNLSNLVWSYSNMHLRHEGLFQAVAKETCARIDEFDPKALAMLTSSFASMRVRHEVLFEAVRCAAETRLDSFQARDLESLAVAFATAQIRADSLFEAIVRRSRTMLADFNSLDLANLAVALRKASWEDPDAATVDLLSDIARHAIPQLRAGNAPSQALVDFAWSFRALPLANLQDFWTAWSSEVLRKMSRHDLRHLVALEALSPAPTRAAVGQQLGRVLYRLLRVLPKTPADWFGEDYSNLLRGLRVADLGAAATAFFLSQLGLAATFQGEADDDEGTEGGECCSKASILYTLHGEPERLISKEESAKLSSLQSTWLSPVRHLRAGPVVDRTQCCLFQALEDFAPVAANREAAARLRITADGTPCVSCVGALAQLRQHLPDLEIDVTLKPRLRE